MPNLLTWAVGSRNPSITENITVNGSPKDLTGATVTFKMRPIGSSTLKVNQPAVVVGDPVGGNVRYDWAAADVDTASPMLVWWEVLLGGKTQTVMEAIIEFRAHAPLYEGYLELEELKKSLTLDGTSFVDLDAQLAILATRDSIEDHCGRRFRTTVADEVRYFDPECWGSEGRYVDGEFQGYYSNAYLNVGDLNSLTSIKVDTDGDGVFETTWASGTDFWLEPYNAPLDGRPYDRIALRAAGGRSFPGYRRSVEITGKWGWAPTPPNVKLAAKVLATRWIKRRESPFGAAGIGPDGEVVRISIDDPDVLKLLNPYTLHSILT